MAKAGAQASIVERISDSLLKYNINLPPLPFCPPPRMTAWYRDPQVLVNIVATVDAADLALFGASFKAMEGPMHTTSSSSSR